jgi:hypothetical protein
LIVDSTYLPGYAEQADCQNADGGSMGLFMTSQDVQNL